MYNTIIISIIFRYICSTLHYIQPVRKGVQGRCQKSYILVIPQGPPIYKVVIPQVLFKFVIPQGL